MTIKYIGLAAVLALCACGDADTPETKDTAVRETPLIDPNTDPYLWLEEVEGDRALEWVDAQNKDSLARLEGDPRFAALKDDALAVYNATDKIAYGSLEGGTVHNFWQDEDNVRGLWRTTDYASYASGTPSWETVLDYDALSEAEGENWVYKGRDCLAPDFSRCLIRLSRGGGDAVVVREFDTATKGFVEGGFVSPETKQNVAWVDADTLLIATDFGEGTMNESGYARQVRLWRRGTPLADAELVLDSDPKIVFNFPIASHRKDGTYIGVLQGPDFFTQVLHLMNDAGELVELDLPRGIAFQGIMGDALVLLMRKDWQTPDGGLIAAGTIAFVNIPAALAGQPTEGLHVHSPSAEGRSIESVDIGERHIFITELADVKSTVHTMRKDPDGTYTVNPVDLPADGAITTISVDTWSDRALMNYESHLTPDTLYGFEDRHVQQIASLPARFDTDGLITEQHFAASKDGTRVPYFVVRREGTPTDGTTPTMLYGYGGFEISLTPSYLTGFARLWVQEGGAYVVANIRGGGEYGPTWHQAALRENRQRAYDDFIAVAEDLIARGLTTPQKLGIRGGSNGGLLMGAMLTQRPDLFGAIICAVPLLDMYRYDKLLAGASWVGEYGDPDNPDDWAFISAYSPYQNVSPDTDYPEVFFYTSTKDDRVHPGHARKMAARMREQGHDLLYYEITEGGHAAAANLKQRAFTDALQVVYALQKLSD